MYVPTPDFWPVHYCNKHPWVLTWYNKVLQKALSHIHVRININLVVQLELGSPSPPKRCQLSFLVVQSTLAW